jgi:predicted TIM-barrel fold metal-dependent hydrolase
VKVSELLSVDANMMPVTDPAFYKPTLDYIFGTFGEDKVLFGSDWPNSIGATNLPAVLQIVQDYFYAKGPRPQKSTSGETRLRLTNGSGENTRSRLALRRRSRR